MKLYLLWFTLTAAFSGIAAGTYVYRVDPFNYFHFATADSESLSYFDKLGHQRFIKPRHVEQLRPQAIIVGSSRSANLRPQHKVWNELRTYNFSVPGISQYETLRFVQHAHALGPLKQLIVGLDFESFIPPSHPFHGSIEERRFLRAPADRWHPGFIIQKMHDAQIAVFSLDAMSHAVQYSRGIKVSGRTFEKDGTWWKQPNDWWGRKGFAFFAKAAEDAYGPANDDTGLHLSALETLLEFSYRENIEVVLLLNPAHFFYLQRLFDLGYESLWRDWHLALVDLNEHVARKYGQQQFAVWGFNTADAIVNEPVMPPGKGHDSWFSDGLHYRGELGVIMINRMLGSASEAEEAAPDATGQRLTVDNVSGYVNKAMAMLNDYELEQRSAAKP